MKAVHDRDSLTQCIYVDKFNFYGFFIHKKIVDFYVYYKNHNYWNLPTDPINQVVTKILLLLIKGCSTLLLMHASLDTV